MTLGLSGHLAARFIRSPLTPLLLICALVVGFLALIYVPREEEPQISVPMVDLLIKADGYKADDAVELITRPLEDLIQGIDGVEHVYSQSQDDGVMVTARFRVGTNYDLAVLRVHDKIRSHIDLLPKGIPEPLIIGRGIDDVAIFELTLSPKPQMAEHWSPHALYQIALELQHDLGKIEDVGSSYLRGGAPDQIRIEPDPERLALFGVTLNQLVDKLTNANRSVQIGNFRDNGQSVPVLAGQTLQGVPDIGELVITTRDGRPVYVKDVAKTIVGGAEPVNYVWTMTKSIPHAASSSGLDKVPAVSLAIAKRKGANAVVVTNAIVDRLERLRGRIIPADLNIEITRNYGETAREKADELLFHLALATLSIVALIVLTIGWREGVVVFVIIPTTILLTLFASWMMGFTINRVSLFALIFSIGILVDDAIVVVENIVRHWQARKDQSLVQSAIEAVAEVGNPTIIATLTIIVALLPMLFVSGLMGPYMSPIPANASMAMLFSFFVAVTITPWLLLKISRSQFEGPHSGGHAHTSIGAMGRFYALIARHLLVGRARSILFLSLVGGATVAVCLLFVTQDVRVKLLPFDNKSEIQVVVDLPRGTALEETDRLITQAALRLRDVPELVSIQAYAGTSAPFNFNGLVRHYYMRSSAEQGDLALNLTAKADRKRSSHAIALEIRERLADLPRPEHTALKVVEVPPGPPVLSTLLAEIYGEDAASRRALVRKMRQAFESVDFIVDVDDTIGVRQTRLRYAIDQDALEYHGVEERAVYDTLQALIRGVKIGYSQRGSGFKPIDISIAMPQSALRHGEHILSTPVPAGGTVRQGVNVELGDVVRVNTELSSWPIYRHNGRYAEMIHAEVAGRFESPIYAMLAVEDQMKRLDWGAVPMPAIKYHGQPIDESKPTLLWDGEWEVTFITFRDMGGAFIIAILGIYLLVVAQFGSFKLPLVILIPVPLTLIGIVLGHFMFNAAFTATSMIGFIALAGIIVRNSILLVDFIRHLRANGRPLREALIEAGAIRFKPIFLTAAAAVIGAVFILGDPIFQGLAISMVFGLISSTLLTLLVIPAVYVVLRDDHIPFSPALRE